MNAIQSCIADVTLISTALAQAKRRPPREVPPALGRLLAALAILAEQEPPLPAIDDPVEDETATVEAFVERYKPRAPVPEEGIPAQKLVPVGGWAAAAGVSTGAVPTPDPEAAERARLQAELAATLAQIEKAKPRHLAVVPSPRSQAYTERAAKVTIVGDGGRTIPLDEQRYIEAELAWAKAQGWAKRFTVKQGKPASRGRKGQAQEGHVPDEYVWHEDGLEKYRALLTKNARARVAYIRAGMTDPKRTVLRSPKLEYLTITMGNHPEYQAGAVPAGRR